MRVSPLNRMLLRDLWAMRGQALAIASVVAAGVAIYVTMLATFHSLDLTIRTYYDRYRMGDVFAGARRAPEALAPRLAAVPGVAAVETRVEAEATLQFPDSDGPVSAHLLSLPEHGRPRLGDLFLKRGAWPRQGHLDEVLVSEAFAKARALRPGDTLRAVLEGRARTFRIVGTAMTPEYVYVLSPGAWLPDDARYGLVWVGRDALAHAFDMDGAFNQVVAKLEPGARPEPVIAAFDRLLEPYGAYGAQPRARQTSNWFLQQEVASLRASGTVMPLIFLGVAAFLIDLVLTRMVGMQREQIAVIKALGYPDARVAWHYGQWGLLISGLGVAVGLGLGVALGQAMTALYTAYFQFPLLLFELPGWVALSAAAVAALASGFGTWKAIRAVLALPPAEAMRPEPPAVYRRGWLDRGRWRAWLSVSTRIVLRNMQRRPQRALVTLLGIALGTAIMVVGTFSGASIDRVMAVQFGEVQRYDAMVSFIRPLGSRTLDALARLPGVLAVEGFRSVGVRMRRGVQERRLALTGLPEAPRLNRVRDDVRGRPLRFETPGLALDDYLARTFDLRPGDTIEVEALEGRRPRRALPVGQVFSAFTGTNAYMAQESLQRFMGEGPSYSGAYLVLDPARTKAFLARCAEIPAVAGVQLEADARRAFDKAMAENFRIQRLFAAAFAGIIAFGVVYNSARIIFSERSRELATLRIIGFSPREVAYVLVGELVILSALAIPTGLALGALMALGLVAAISSELYRIPLVLDADILLSSAGVVAIATAVSAWWVARGLGKLDLVAVLKTKE